jgi:hypothetical protein
MQIECKWCSRLSRHSLKHKLYVICDLYEEASLPSFLCDSLQGYIQMALFFRDSQKEIPKLGPLLSWNFGRSYLPQFKPFWSIWGNYFIALKWYFQHYITCPNQNYLTLILRGFVVGSQIPNLTPNPSFDHNSCILCLNEH